MRCVTISVDDDIEEETLLTKIEAYDLDSGQNAEIEYSLWFATDNGLDIFTIDQITGKLFASYNLDQLDANVIDSYVVTVMAMDKGYIPRASMTNVFVEVKGMAIPRLTTEDMDPSEGSSISTQTAVATEDMKPSEESSSSTLTPVGQFLDS
ncbi:protocadherin alpha-11-like [Ptychodera flava]|uniref:protocadherin alpha-11-like n=1 Tax=Ptychodera flava TaxID=63121 RepID=UPI003969CE59